MSACERRQLYKRVLNLTEKIRAFANLERIDSTSPVDPVTPVHTGRILIPGQVLRFPSDQEWVQFLSYSRLTEDDWELIQTADPICPGAAEPVDGPNPLNFLRRAQLPAMQIEMTSAFNPLVRGYLGFSGTFPLPTIPLLGTSKGGLGFMAQPWVYSRWYGTDAGSILRDRVSGAVSLDTSDIQTVVSSWVPKYVQGNSLTGAEGLQFLMRQLGVTPNYTDMTAFGVMGSIDSFKIQTTVRFVPIPTGQADVILPQPVSVAQPSVGCFWFNDGREPQIELPKDPLCRKNILVKIKTWIAI